MAVRAVKDHTGKWLRPTDLHKVESPQLWNQLKATLAQLEADDWRLSERAPRAARIRFCRMVAAELQQRGEQMRLL